MFQPKRSQMNVRQFVYGISRILDMDGFIFCSSLEVYPVQVLYSRTFIKRPNPIRWPIVPITVLLFFTSVKRPLFISPRWPLNRGWTSSSPKRTRLSLLFKTRIRFPNQFLLSTLWSFTLQSKIASANIEEFLCNWSFSLVGFVPPFCDKVNSKCWFWHDYFDAGTDHRICYGSPLVQNLIAHSVNNCDYALLCAIFLSFLVTYTGSVQYSVNRG